MRVRQVQQHRHGQVAAGRITADDHVRGCPATVGEDVAERANGLAQLGWVDFVRGEGVPREEDGDVVAVFVDDLQEVEPEVEVGGYGGDGEAASCGCTGCRLAFGWKGCMGFHVFFSRCEIGLHGAHGEEIAGGLCGKVCYGRTVVVNNHVLCILVAQPVSLSAVGEVNYLRLEASTLHHCMISLWSGRVNVSIEHRAC